MGGIQVDEPESLKSHIKFHFQSHFSGSVEWSSLTIDDIQVRQFSESNSAGLIAVFSEEEIRGAVWDCEGQKSPSPDSINFTFLKDF